MSKIHKLPEQLSSKFFPLLMISVFVLTLLVPIIPTKKAYANESGEWIDRPTIKLGNDTFIDDNPFDGGSDGFQYLGRQRGPNCLDVLKVTNYDEGGNEAKLQKKKVIATGECVADGGETDVTLGSTDKRYVTAYQIDENTVFMPVYPHQDDQNLLQGGITGTNHGTKRNGQFKRLPNESAYCQQNNNVVRDDGPDKDKCGIFVRNGVDIPANNNSVWINTKEEPDNVQFATCPGGVVGSNCNIDGRNIVFANNRVFTKPPGYDESIKNKDSAGGEKKDANSADGTKPNCEQNAKVSMGWVLCGVLDAIDSILIGDHGLLAITENLLNVNSKQYDNSQLKQSWSYFKNIATFLLILIGLVMIIGQAVSKE